MKTDKVIRITEANTTETKVPAPNTKVHTMFRMFDTPKKICAFRFQTFLMRL
jgi:hypothetical protein